MNLHCLMNTVFPFQLVLLKGYFNPVSRGTFALTRINNPLSEVQVFQLTKSIEIELKPQCANIILALFQKLLIVQIHSVHFLGHKS